MLSMARKFDVLHSHFIEGKGVKTIARESGLSRTTVRNYVREFAEQKQEIIAGGDKSEILLAMSEAPRYHSAGRERTALTDPVVEMIRECLNQNDRKKALGQKKLCMKATDIHEYLDEKGIHISYPSVCTCVRELSAAHKEAFIKQDYRPGEVCEFDWGEVRLTVAGRSISYRMAVFTLAASNIRWSALYRTEDTQAFVDAHIRFLRWLEGVPYLMVYDNLRVAVAKFVGKNEKEATVALKQLSTYYGFAFRFCNIRKGNEKGHVERSVEFVRRKAFARVNTFDDGHLRNGDGLRQRFAHHAGVFRQGAEQDALRRPRTHRRRINCRACRRRKRTHGLDHMGESPGRQDYQERCEYCEKLSHGNGA